VNPNLPVFRCVNFVEVVTEWEAGGLADDVRSEVEEHLGLCPDCVDYVEQLRRTVGSLRGLPDEGPPAPARDAVLRAFRERRISR
jgi:anti-sigma factor RsiW